MKRYALFSYPAYYPGGGWSDFVDSFDTVEECVERCKVGPYIYEDNRQVIDLATGEDVTPDNIYAP